MSEPDQYVLGYRQAEQRRLQEQAQQLAHESSWLFDQTGVARGARVLEIGCGPRKMESIHLSGGSFHVCFATLVWWMFASILVIHVYPPGHDRRGILFDFAENLSERILAQNLVGERELAGLKTALQRHIDDPETLVVSHLFFQAWGRKPV